MSVRRRARAAVAARRKERQKVIDGLDQMASYLAELLRDLEEKITAEKTALKTESSAVGKGGGL